MSRTSFAVSPLPAPLARHLTRRRMLLATAALLLAGTAGAILHRWSAKSAECLTFERLEVGMAYQDATDLMDSLPDWNMTGLSFGYDSPTTQYWRSENGARIVLSFRAGGLTEKSFEESDLSLRSRLKRFARRLPLHQS